MIACNWSGLGFSAPSVLCSYNSSTSCTSRTPATTNIKSLNSSSVRASSLVACGLLIPFTCTDLLSFLGQFSSLTLGPQLVFSPAHMFYTQIQLMSQLSLLSANHTETHVHHSDSDLFLQESRKMCWRFFGNIWHAAGHIFPLSNDERPRGRICVP